MVKLTIQLVLIFVLAMGAVVFIAFQEPAHAYEPAQKSSSAEVTPDAVISPSIGSGPSLPIIINTSWPLEQAMKELRNSLNPVAFRVAASGYDPIRRVYWFDFFLKPVGPDGREGARVRVNVSQLTGAASLQDRALKEAALKVRGDAALHLGVGLPDVFLKDFSFYREIGIGYRTGFITYQLTLKVGEFTVQYEATRVDGQRSFTVKLVSLRNEIGVDLLAAAEKYLKDLFNPDEYSLAYWGDGDGVIGFAFKLKDGSIVKVDVDKKSGLASIPLPKGLEAAVMATREEIASRMGVDINEVHINGIQALMHVMIYPSPYSEQYQVTARVGNYTLVLDYSKPNVWWYDEILIPSDNPIVRREAIDGEVISRPILPRFVWPVITLKSFVDNRTGRDYVKEAGKYFLDLFNPEFQGTDVAYWSYSDGNLQLYYGLGLFRIYDAETVIFWGKDWPIKPFGNILITVNLKEGKVGADPSLVEAVTKARKEASDNLKLAISDVHVNGAWFEPNLMKVMCTEAFCPESSYVLIVSTPKFNLSFRYGENTHSLTLTSLLNRETGVYLLKSAMDYMKGAFNPDSLTLDSWGRWDPIDDVTLQFVFKLPDGTLVRVNVNQESGFASPADPRLVEAALRTREDIASRMGVGLTQVHINGIQGLPQIAIHPAPYSALYQITARVDHYTLVMNYAQPNLWWYEDPIQIIGPIDRIDLTESVDSILPGGCVPPIRFIWPTITLKSFVDNWTGRDYVKEAHKFYVNLFNAEYYGGGVNDWAYAGDNLRLYFGSGKYYIDGEVLFDYFQDKYYGHMWVDVNLKTGQISMDPKVVEAVTKSRQELSQKLKINLSDVHVNGVYGTYVPPCNICPSEPGVYGYKLILSTPRFNATLQYRFDTGKLELMSLWDRQSWVDVVWKAKNDLVEKNSFQYGAIHIRDFSIVTLKDGREAVWFNIKVDGKDETYGYYIDPKTGEIIDSWTLIDARTAEIEPIKPAATSAAQAERADEGVLKELLDRKGVEERAQTQASNRSYPHLADEKNALKALQTK